jgi:DNA (cytosine-5)-methyltransferase 1
MASSTDLLIRNVSPEHRSWIAQTMPVGTTQNDYLKALLKKIIDESTQPSLFEHNSAGPRIIHGRLPFRFIDLFAGIGGFRCAMTALGGECVFTSEWDKYSVKTYREWYQDKHIYTDDIREISPAADIPDHDILCAGFPCQPFSLAGVSKKKSLGRAHGFDDETQGNLFFTIMNIVDHKRPPVLFLENVKNLRSHDKGNTWKVIRNEIESRDYVVFDRVIDAQNWVPQHRERVFIVCFDKRIFGEQPEYEFPVKTNEVNPMLGDILHSKAPEKKYMLSDKLWKYLQDYAAKHRAKGNGFGYGLFGKSDIARTLSARYHKDGSEILIKQPRWKNPRRLTPAEAMGLMGFESRYAEMFGHDEGFPQVVSDTQAYRQFGNAVVPLVVEAIGTQIVSTMVSTIQNSQTGCLLKGREIAVA